MSQHAIEATQARKYYAAVRHSLVCGTILWGPCSAEHALLNIPKSTSGFTTAAFSFCPEVGVTLGEAEFPEVHCLELSDQYISQLLYPCCSCLVVKTLM